jgi:hypothetical protein
VESEKNDKTEAILVIIVNTAMGIIMVLIIQLKIIRPIDKLSRMMSTKQNKGKMEKFVSRIKKQQEKQES